MNQKKTVGRYRLVLSKEQTTLPISCNSTTGEILPPTFTNKGMELTILDQHILQKFENEQQLCLHLQSLGYIIPQGYRPKIAYQSEGQTKLLEIVYQNPMLAQMANICQKQKEKYQNLSGKEFRQSISKGIKEEPTWIQFYRKLKADIKSRDFCDYIINSPLLGKRILQQIRNYLDELPSSEYYLGETFTSYKPIRGMILMRQQYQETLGIPIDYDTPENELQQLSSYFSEPEMMYIEKHDAYERMTTPEKLKLLKSFLERTARPKTYQKQKEHWA